MKKSYVIKLIKGFNYNKHITHKILRIVTGLIRIIF